MIRISYGLKFNTQKSKIIRLTFKEFLFINMKRIKEEEKKPSIIKNYMGGDFNTDPQITS